MYKGKCQAFVADCYAYGAGMTRRSASSAKVARNLWRVSTSQSNIPVGAAVYFDSPTSPQYGHVGLHIGNNQVIHAFGTVKQMSVSAIIECGYAWQGWGWNGGVKPTGAGTTVPAGTSDGGDRECLPRRVRDPHPPDRKRSTLSMSRTPRISCRMSMRISGSPMRRKNGAGHLGPGGQSLSLRRF